MDRTEKLSIEQKIYWQNRKAINGATSIAFEDFLGSSIALQVMPPWSYLDHSEALAHWPLRSNLLTSHSVCEKHKLYVALTWALHNGQTNMHLPNTLWILDVTIIPVCWNTSPTIGQYWSYCGWVETGRLCPPDLSANCPSNTIA